MIEQILNGLYGLQIDLPQNPLKCTDCYFITGEDRNLLIDTAFRCEMCRESLSDGLRELGVSMDNTDILLTHLHGDHSGLAPDFASPTSRVYVSRGEIPWLCGDTIASIRQRDVDIFTECGFDREVVEKKYGALSSVEHGSKCRLSLLHTAGRW